MLYVVKGEELLFKCDAWSPEVDTVDEWIAEHGYTLVRERITLLGDLIKEVR